MSATEANTIARRKSRYGHKPWIVYREKSGELTAAKATQETIKAAMMAHGSQKHFWGYWSDGSALIVRWQMGLLWLRNMKAGHFYY